MTKLEQFFKTFSREAFRLELLDYYNVPEDKKELNRFLSGELFPRTDDLREWFDFLDDCQENNKRVTRTHIVPDVLTPYLRFEIEWGYVYTANAGEIINIVKRRDFNTGVFE